MKVFGVNIDLKHSFWLVMDVALRTAAAIAGSVLFIRVAGAEYYGKYQYIFSLSALGALIMLPGFNNGLLNSAANGTEGDFDAAAKYKFKFYPLYMAFFTVAATVMYALGKGWDIVWGFIIAGVMGGLLAVLSGYQSYYPGKKDYKAMCLWNFLLALSSIVPGIIYIVCRAFNSKISVFGTCFGTLLWQGAISYLLFRNVKNRFTNMARNSGLDKYSVNLSAMSIVGGAQGYLDQFIVGSFISYSSLAYYNLAKRFFEVFKSIWGISQNYLQPRLTDKTWETANKYFIKYLHLYAVILPGFALIYLITPWLFTFFYGKEFVTSANYARLLLAVILVSVPNFYLESYFRAQESHKDLWISRITNLAMLGALVPMVYFWSVWGLISCRIITALSGSIIMAIVFYKQAPSLQGAKR